MPDIDPSKIKPGDTVRVRFQNIPMERQKVPPIEFTTTTYSTPSGAGVMAGHVFLDENAGVTILEHIPARPDWADALVVRDKDGLLHLADADRGGFNCQNGAHWPVADMRSLEPITVVIDADGNPPEHEHEWLDADALDKLPTPAVIIPRWLGLPRWRKAGRWVRIDGDGPSKSSAEIAPARLLWTPEADR